MAAARPDTWMPVYIGDYLADTMHLGRAQHGSYLLLIFALWRSEGELKDDDLLLQNVAKMTSREWRRERAILEPFFIVADGVWRHKRVDEELQAARAFIDQRKGAGKASAEARKGQRNANEKPTTVATDAQRQVKTSPSPSPVVTTALPVSHSASERRFEPVGGSAEDNLEIPKFLRRAPHAQMIGPDWLPSEQAQADLVKERPDLTPERIVERTAEFQLWCAETNKTTHNPDATWLGFMRRTHEQRSRNAPGVQSGQSPATDGIAAAFARRSVSSG